MGKRFKLKEIEQKKGDLHKVIPPLINRNGGDQKVAAEKLNVSQATISTWLKDNGYRMVKRWERGEQAS